MERTCRILTIGLDGATFDLIEPWAETGYLPIFARLMSEGAYGHLRSTIPPMTAPAWTSFMTGVNPGKHGLYDWIYRRDGSYDVSPVTASRCKEPTLWSILSDAGRRVCAFNVPMTYPPKLVNGLMISGMPATSTKTTITYPKELLQEIEEQVGPYLLYPDPGSAYSDSGIDAFLKRLYRTTEMRLKVLDYLYDRELWDFFMVVLNGTDTVQHAMWKFMSREHPLHDPSKRTKYGGTILEYFQYVDTALGKILAGLDEDTVLLLMSDHGFGPFHKFIHVNNWLQEQGWLKINNTLKARGKANLFRHGLAPMNIYNWLMALGLGVLKREVVRGEGQGLLKKLFLSFEDVDWPQTQAYSLGNVGQIFLNVRGREPQGCVNKGQEYEVVRDEIMARLWDLRDPETGEQVVEEVYRREEIYAGSEMERAADILFLPTRMEYFGFGEYEFGSNEIIETMKRGISGTHRMNGMMLLWGKPIRPSTVVQGAQITDLAPTILHLLGEPVPSTMDGRVLGEVLMPEFAQQHRVAGELPVAEQASLAEQVEDLSSEEERLIVERLRGLGYVG